MYFSTAHERTTMLQQRRIEILYHKFPEIFRGIIPEKYHYYSGKIPQEISELPTLIGTDVSDPGTGKVSKSNLYRKIKQETTS